MESAVGSFESERFDAIRGHLETLRKHAGRSKVDDTFLTSHKQHHAVRLWREGQVIDDALNDAFSGGQVLESRTVDQHARLENPTALVINAEIEERPTGFPAC